MKTMNKMINEYCYYEKEWNRTSWLGYRMQKYPTDLFIMQDLIFRTKPNVIIETGTKFGGSALFFASIQELVKIDNHKVITIDIKAYPNGPCHPNIFQIRGSSVAEATYNEAKKLIAPNDRVMVILDTLHTRVHVEKEIEFYAQLVTSGCYLIVEDTNIGGNPVKSLYDEGEDENGAAFQAVDNFLAHNHQFVRDTEVEIFTLTQNPGGYLRRV